MPLPKETLWKSHSPDLEHVRVRPRRGHRGRGALAGTPGRRQLCPDSSAPRPEVTPGHDRVTCSLDAIPAPSPAWHTAGPASGGGCDVCVCAQLCTSGRGSASGTSLPRANGLGRAPEPAAPAHSAGKAWLEALERGWHRGSRSSGIPQPPDHFPGAVGSAQTPLLDTSQLIPITRNFREVSWPC